MIAVRKIVGLFIILTVIVLASNVSALMQSNINHGDVEGYLISKNENSLVIEEYGGSLYLLPLHENATLLIDNRPVGFSDFIPGMEIFIKVRDGSITHLEGYSAVNLGYISPGSKLRTGTIISIDRDQLTIRTTPGEEKTYFLSPATLILRNGQRVQASNLYVGDNVKLYFDEVDSIIASRVELEGPSINVSGIYRGTLNITNGFTNSIALQDVKVLRNGSWQHHNSYMSFPINRETPIYFGGGTVSPNNFKYYTGSNVYLVTRNFFGNERAERLLIQSRYEGMHTDKITDLNWYTGAFELNNNRNFTFNDGTIIVKNGRIVDPYSLTVGSDAIVISDSLGSSRTANLIYILNEDINHSNMGYHHLYAGKLDMVLEDFLVLEDFFLLEKNQWESYDDEKELFFDNDTYIYDMEDNTLISSKELYSGDYAVDEKSKYARNNNLRSWYAYAYTDGDRITVLGLKKSLDSLLRQRITNGSIKIVEDNIHVGWTVELINANDWSRRHEQWMPRNDSIRINLENALIIKDDKLIKPYELKSGDRLYIVRDDFEGRVVIVK